MNTKKMIAACFAVCLFAAVAEDAPSLESALNLAPQRQFANIARKVANMLPAYHVTQHTLDDAISQRAWTNLVTMYDYNHAVFLQGDLDRFAPMQTGIDDALRQGDVSFAYDVHRTFVRRLGECIAFVTNYLEKGEIDFSVDETYLYNRKDAPWPETAAARDDIWRQRIKNEMLAQILGRELDEEEDAAEAGEKKKARARGRKAAKDRGKAEEAKADGTNAVVTAEKPEPTPKEALLNKYRHYLAWVLTELDETKVMERYLLATAMAYDPHSGYMAPDSKEDFDMDMSLSLCGVGAVLTQSMDDGVLLRSHRGHTAADTVRAARLVQDAGFALILQMMAGLPGDSTETLLATGRQIASLRPDGVRIYPVVVLRGTLLEAWMHAGIYTPLSLEDAVADCAQLIDLFARASIPILRIGLNPSESLACEVVAGAYHPALGERCYARWYLNRLMAGLAPLMPAERAAVYVHPSRLSVAAGQHRANAAALKSAFPSLKKLSFYPADCGRDEIRLETSSESPTEPPCILWN